ncbi:MULTISPECIES: TRAP transporter large permease [Aerococcus]|uniref:TRAP transporter large permease n=1 Tax=Aerococcus sanguinicola TaxID=119206 RepID=A0A5N1GFF0_9LACT|nr:MULTISPECIES: TRAP transporter large permease [Aerococcus]KAA9299657.1 TRAP transporter large permease [Aerococcus sanguinicola]MDK6369952.1 TRAP transporter large permease [Aerococcus sp. UMB9870]MDK6680574.1 TRAP transporter large permease [Aerococcus sp. UMB8608]MDK6687404.1 TRAP transporter large permease [Aerococcus sp. UMB8623]MDK6940475.1 TRAP transporter large permease [Aerococcus sp. UMB8487]
MAIQSLLIMIALLAILLVLGIPIAIAIGISAIGAILPTMSLETTVITAAQRIFSGTSTFTLVAIPFFVLAGNIMNQGGIAKRLVNFVEAIVGKIPGSLLLTNVGANALFGAISGSAAAAAAAVGGMVQDGEREQGYDMNLAAATNGASAPSGLLIPPSNALITYSLVSGGTSVAALFMAGYLPGLIWTLACMVVAFIMARKKGYLGDQRPFDWKRLGKATLDALLPLSLIIVVIGGIIAGVFTATEGSAIAVIYALFISVVVYRSIGLKDLYKILVDSAETSGMVVFLIGVSNILSWVMAFTGIPQAIAGALLSITENPLAIMLIINIILLISGTFMDVTPAILIFTPIFLPIATSFGMSPVHFGIIMVYNLCIGNITPPVGNTLFVAIRVGKSTLADVMPYMLSYYGAILAGLLLVTYVPAISLWLPELAGLL